jgi:hypothetical protein
MSERGYGGAMSATTAVYIRSARGIESVAEQREETLEYADDELGIDSANIRTPDALRSLGGLCVCFRL